MNNFKPTQTMLNNYIQNKLSDNETQQLELWLVDHPEAMEDLEMGVMFKQADFDHETAQKKMNSQQINWFKRLFQKPVFIFSHIAMIAIGMFLFNIFISNTSTNSVATFVELEKQRGLDTSVIEIHAQIGSHLVLRLFPDSMNEKYKIVVSSKVKSKKIEFKNLQVDDFGSITITFMSNNIYGDWEVSLTTGNDILQQHYSVHVIR